MMAIPGMYEITWAGWCACCKKQQTLRARSPDWTGDIRTNLICTSPGCTTAFEKGNAKHRKTKGNVSSRPPIRVATQINGTHVVLEEYECGTAEARHFCELFQQVLERIPSVARETILAHWQTGCGSPHVWLLANRREWRGSGWAASGTGGLSLYFTSLLVDQIPDEHIRTAIAHEFGHILFVAGNELNHVPRAISLETMLEPPPADPLRKVRAEWLVWRLLDAWGFDQPAMEEWMERHTIDDANGVILRETSQTDAEFKGKCILDRKRHEELLKDMTFPAEFDRYRNG